jgi:hypothetical protein
MRPAVRIAATALAALALAPTALAGGPGMEVGSVLEEAQQPTLPEAQQRVALAEQAALGGAYRFSITWARGDTAPSSEALVPLENAVTAAQAAHGDVYVVAYPYGSSQTPVSDADQQQFVTWLTALAHDLPTVRHFIVGNEPNLNGFWLPQFGPDGTDVAAPAYEALLASAYDALKAVSPSIDVIGGVLAHAGADHPGTSRDTHSPTAFIRDLGQAYRASGRTKPIMDEFAMHPYMLDSSESPTLTHPHSTTITIADYWKLVPLLGEAFDGTAQVGSTLPIVYDEFGVENVVPADEASLYVGTQPASAGAVDIATQELYYRQAMQLAFCQPNVRAFLIFQLIDDPNLAGWQSEIYYPNLTRKPNWSAVRTDAREVQRNVIAHCAWLHVTPKPTVVFFPSGHPGPAENRFPVALTCDVDCTYTLRVVRVSGQTTTLEVRGAATGGVGKRIAFPPTRLAPGTYRLTLATTAMENAGAPAVRASAPFVIAR